MSNLVVITFDEADEAGKVREALRSIEKQGQISLDELIEELMAEPL